MYQFEENDDEAEKLARRQVSSPANDSLSNASSKSLNLSSTEIKDQIEQCLKLNAENKISDKNAFHLKLIDLFDYSLSKCHPSMDNFQVASACLDASGKIYGYRVDKVHSDLIKIVGITRKRTNSESDHDQVITDEFHEDNRNKRKKRARRKQVISTVTELIGNLEFYNPLAAINNQRDPQTTDMLYQASLPHHVYGGIALSFYNDVLLDRITFSDSKSTTFLITKMICSPMLSVCPSYETFKFLNWFMDETPSSNENESLKSYHFNEAEVLSEDNSVHNSDVFKRFFNAAEIENFEDIISNQSNGSVSLEYTYLRENIPVRFVGPKHWKAKFNKNVEEPKVRKQKPKDLTFSTIAKNKAQGIFKTKGKASQIKTTNWSEKDNEISEITLSHDFFYRYFNKRVKYDEEDVRDSENPNLSILSDFNLDRLNDLEKSGNHSEDENPLNYSPDRFHDNNEGFIGDNLISPPKLVDPTFIPYSKQAKKINMKELNREMWHNIIRSKEHTKEFSRVYLELPSALSRNTAKSLSPALAYVSLLHVAHKENLTLKSQSDFSDLIIER